MKQKGFSLIELVIVVAIIAILSAIAYPSYLKYTQKSKRSAAQQIMLEYASKQEQYMLDARNYWPPAPSAGASIDPFTDGTLIPLADIASEVTDNYTFVIDTINDNSPPEYTITATPIPGTVMEGQDVLTLNSRGEKTPTDKW